MTHPDQHYSQAREGGDGGAKEMNGNEVVSCSRCGQRDCWLTSEGEQWLCDFCVDELEDQPQIETAVETA